MQLTEKQQWAIITIIFVAGATIFGYNYYNDMVQEKRAKIFFSNLMNAKDIAVVMDLRNAPDNKTRYNINVCGVGISGSPALAAKPKYIYGIDDDVCIISYPNNTHDSNASVERCDREIYQFTSIIIKYGNPHTEFNERSMVIYVDKNTNSTCRLTIS